tara:strand:- start:757 stop:1173 length:417 start_codon:yes stop_codon:yes gene_type:complete
MSNLIPQSNQDTYRVYGSSNFNGFIASNWADFFPSDQGEQSGNLMLLKNQMELFKKAFMNSIGGCPCNAKKRREIATKAYKETVDTLLKSPPEVKEICFKNLGNVKEILFFTETPDEVAKIVANDASNLVPFCTFKKS